MEQISQEERATAVATFKKVLLVQPNGKSTMMAKCKNCNIPKANVDHDMWKHWKYTCPEKLLFKYSYKTATENQHGSVSVICLLCKQHFNELTIGFMTSHRKQCKITEQSKTKENVINNSDAVEKTTVSFENTQNESNDYRQPVVYEPSGELLVSVQTIPTSVQSTETSDDPSMIPSGNESRKCFICDSSRYGPFTNVYEHINMRSNKPIINFIWKILGEQLSPRMNSIEDVGEEEEICVECLEMIRSYDAANNTAKRLKKQLRNRLAKTEAYCCSTQNVIDDIVDIDAITDGGDESCVINSRRNVGNGNEVIDLCND